MKSTQSVFVNPKPPVGSWRESIARFQNPALRRSVWQLCNTLIPYFLLMALMVWSLRVSYWLTLILAVPTAGFVVRIFIIFHDCTHGSFFKSQKVNDAVGFVMGVLSFTPFADWRHDHAMHHATSGDLDRRGFGDIDTMTVKEYLQASNWKRFLYRLSRHPLVLFGFAPLFIFVIRYRFALSHAGKRERASVFWTNVCLFAILVVAHFTIGLKAYLLVQLPTMAIATAAGIWLFYVQHQFEGVYWERNQNWNFETQALEGSSFYKLPKILQWFTGSIGFHHIHHLSPRIPNYYLERCHQAEPTFQRVKTLTLLSSLKSLTYRLWDEERRALVGFRDLKNHRN